MAHALLRFSDRITAVPVIHGSGDFAVEVRRLMLAEKFDCLAVPLPPSFKHDVEQAIAALPVITLVTQSQAAEYTAEDDAEPPVNYVPIDPCQPVIAAIRVALGERMRREYVDLEVDHFESYAGGFPDPYALKKLPLEKFVAAILPALPRLPEGQPRQRIARMARRLAELEKKHKSILFICSLLDWPWIREAYNFLHDGAPKGGVASATLNPPHEAPNPDDDEVEPTSIHQP